MAHKKQYWKDTLQTAKPERSGFDSSNDQEQQKKQARVMYNRRKLEKDIKRYIKNGRINSKAIERIGRQHGFYIGESPFRESKVSHEDA